MAASTSDLFTGTTNGTRPVAVRLTAPRSIGGTTFTTEALTGWETLSKVHFQTYKLDSSSAKIESSKKDWTGIVASSTSITNLELRAGTDDGNAISDVVEAMPTAAWADDLYKGLVVEHTPTGTHTNITATGFVQTTGTHTIPSAVITPNNLVASSGTTWAWDTWVPTWTNLTVGNGTVTAKYKQIGKNVHFKLSLVWGSTTSVSGTVSVSLPVTSVSVVGSGVPLGSARLIDISAGLFYTGFATHLSTTTMKISWSSASGSGQIETNISNVSPATWTTSDEFHLNGFYEAA
jgi:hypothetical protein